MDSIAEMRVLTSNYQAEYGRNANGVISVVTKGGSRNSTAARGPTSATRCSMPRASSRTTTASRRVVTGSSSGATPSADRFTFRSSSTPERRSCSSSSRRSTPSRSRRPSAATPTCRRWRSGPATSPVTTDANGVPVPLPTRPPGTRFRITTIAGLAALNPAAAKAGQAILNALPLPNICGHSGRFLDRLHPGRPVRHPAIAAQLLLEFQRDSSRGATTPCAWTTI